MAATGPVLFVLGSSAGGVGRHVAALCRRLRAEGVDVRVAAPADTLRRFAFGVPATPVEIGPTVDPVRDLGAARALRRAAAAVPGVLVHAHGVRAGFVAALALPRRTPLVVTLHNAVLGRGARARLGLAVLARVCRRADVVLGVSGDLVAQAHRLGAGVVDRALVPAPALAPGDAARGRAVLGEGPVALAVARLAPQKGLGTLLEAAGRSGVRVAVAGDGPLHDELAARVRAGDLPVQLLGRRDDVADLLAATDVALSASVWEGQPVFVQEALRAGVPLVATDAGGTREVTGDAALLVPVGDATALAEALARLVADPVERGVRAERSRQRAAQLPTEDDLLEQVRRVHAAARG
ncbi:glycosyltransferase family 4 protein [Kineococcus rhizosphaerae]|uniref:Glycosyltransferase involved in cell wall biosynthesis n=1 Tax=Kineococcus rhizosphaerae TaxID=559628 RepID=A0A2T0R9G2_9ACTN|nr:glycosyltransferase family 4 protein [Kineococcus rhizosphaerae]PRY17780.1 glycosyltransferase involved in cell wall biosynthesis [Kineococcus rhizosphaerae]